MSRALSGPKSDRFEESGWDSGCDGLPGAGEGVPGAPGALGGASASPEGFA